MTTSQTRTSTVTLGPAATAVAAFGFVTLPLWWGLAIAERIGKAAQNSTTGEEA